MCSSAATTAHPSPPPALSQQLQQPEQQQQVLAALEFKCSVLWAMCDALQHAYVDPKDIPPGAFVPEA